jgi:hypothetical protein
LEVHQIRYHPTFAHLARCAAAIRFLPAAEIVRFGFGAWPFAFAHRAFCACAILRRETADTMRVGRLDLRDTPVPFKDSITEIAWSNVSTCNCVRLRSSRSC